MRVSDFDYSLPPELIAQAPLDDRSASRMLVVDRASNSLADRHFRDLPEFLRPGDCLVLNESKVIPCRLFGKRAAGQGGKVEVFLLRPTGDEAHTWTALVKPGRRLRVGDIIEIDSPSQPVTAEIIDRSDSGKRTLRFSTPITPDLLERIGHIPLPPYIRREDAATDRQRYQTVYARQAGSVAAPTAGLHFTPEVLDRCTAQGATIAKVTLHVGLGTFQPLSTDVVSEIRLHSEQYDISPEASDLMRAAKRLIPIGTTSLRTIEGAGIHPGSGETDIFISPGYQFRHAAGLVTNFHLPSTSLLLLVAAFAGADLTRRAYRHAVESRYRFYSYGDCMLVL